MMFQEFRFKGIKVPGTCQLQEEKLLISSSMKLYPILILKGDRIPIIALGKNFSPLSSYWKRLKKNSWSTPLLMIKSLSSKLNTSDSPSFSTKLTALILKEGPKFSSPCLRAIIVSISTKSFPLYCQNKKTVFQVES